MATTLENPTTSVIWRRPILNRMPWGEGERDRELLLAREWLVTNGLGGYASGSISGACTRRYHGFLVAALPAPYGRMLMLNHLAEELRLPGGKVVQLGANELPGGNLELFGANSLREFRLEAGVPVWRYETGDFVIEKSVVLPHQQNTVYVKYSLISGSGSIRLRVRPSVHFRPHDYSVASTLEPYAVTAIGDGFEISCPKLQIPPLRFRLDARPSAMILDGGRVRDLFYRIEHARGYDSMGKIWSPGYFRTDLHPGGEATLVASTESCDIMTAISPGEAFEAEAQRRWRLVEKAHPAAQEGMAAELVLAADQFIITPATRVADAARSRAAGDEVRTVIAGYHWFTDWGRDTMISLDGLTLITGRQQEAGYILRGYAHHVRDGLIPNLFPEGEREGLYHTADATLWYFHAIDRYLRATGDTATLRLLWPTLRKIIDHHLQGTRFGIHVDPQDGLLSQGEAGYQLTWMDAKVDNWVVTPRRGKAVEINALWYNALRLMEHWAGKELDDSSTKFFAEQADRTLNSFNQRFWFDKGGYLYDVIDGEKGDDPAMRPNQVLAISLPHPVLDRSHWEDVMKRVEERLITPVGLRSLAPGEPDYKERYYGDLRSRDAAYHQGTVWAWLIGPFIDAWLKLHPGEFAQARRFLDGFGPHLGEACIGSVSEIFDAADPYSPRGCVGQAWSVAEVLRCWVKTAGEESASTSP